MRAQASIAAVAICIPMLAFTGAGAAQAETFFDSLFKPNALSNIFGNTEEVRVISEPDRPVYKKKKKFKTSKLQLRKYYRAKTKTAVVKAAPAKRDIVEVDTQKPDLPQVASIQAAPAAKPVIEKPVQVTAVSMLAENPIPAVTEPTPAVKADFTMQKNAVILEDGSLATSNTAKTIECLGDNFAITGDGNTFIFLGQCNNLTVNGNGNIITLEAVNNISIVGKNNSLKWRNSANSNGPVVNNVGTANFVGRAQDWMVMPAPKG